MLSSRLNHVLLLNASCRRRSALVSAFPALSGSYDIILSTIGSPPPPNIMMIPTGRARRGPRRQGRCQAGARGRVRRERGSGPPGRAEVQVRDCLEGKAH